jgi:DNA-binding FadR family transcriptional regulator
MTIARDALLRPIEPAKATDQVISRIAQAISSGVLRPGDQLPVESELAAQLDVAQMTLRQALAILRDLGCIETVRGRNGGSFVTRRPIDIGGIFQGTIPTIDEIQEITDFRMAIENEAYALAALRADRVALGEIQIHLEECVSGSKNGNDHWLADNAFHVKLAEASRSTRLVKAVSEIQYEMTSFYGRLTRPYEPILPHMEEHIEIANAIASGDPDRAWEASNNHLMSNHYFLLDLVQKVSSE